MKQKKVLFHISFVVQLIGLLGFFGMMIDSNIKNLRGMVVSDVSKETIITLGILLFLGIIGLLLSNKFVDQLNKLENAANKI